MITVSGIIFIVISLIVSSILRKKFSKYKKISLNSGITGAEVSAKMLKDYGIYDVKITCVSGHLTDHYNPANKTINLSRDVFYGNSVSAAAVAAHECGHAVQHANSYAFLKLRTALVPLQSISAKLMNMVMFAMIFGFYFMSSTVSIDTILLIAIGCYAVFTVFSFITLPVEFDASNRAIRWITEKGVVNSKERSMAKDALKWAAMTYVVVALASLAQLAELILRYSARR